MEPSVHEARVENDALIDSSTLIVDVYLSEFLFWFFENKKEKKETARDRERERENRRPVAKDVHSSRVHQ